ncbi:MAG: hypothetical protein A3C36_00070 [Omnitrophica WOR_2 bacterium RIFCSPHIGHO2_02_FULL_52_10]|nr:MAG: hypothetical protein A3C36_00070 [Omnitrophica WOR_2 bacterium RIFCSPHIGHO2_02_FULL_52_10]
MIHHAGLQMKTPKSIFILICTVVELFASDKPLAAFNGSGRPPEGEFTKRMDSYLAGRFRSVKTRDRQAMARLGRTRFINRNFRGNINKRPNFNQRLQRKLNKKFSNLRAHKSRRFSGRRIKANRLVKRKSLLTEGRRAFQNNLRQRLQNRPHSHFRERLHDRFQRQNNGPRIRRSGARHHR